MGQLVTPRSGSKSAPTVAPKPDVSKLGPSNQSKPTDAPKVRSTRAPSKNGSWETPSSVKANPIDQKAPTSGSKDPNIERTP